MNTLWPCALLLDFYGTVVEEDDEPIGAICGQIAGTSALGVSASEVGAYWSEVFARMCCDSEGDTFQPQREIEKLSLEHILRRFQSDLDADELSHCLYNYWSYPTILPVAKAVLAQCGMPVCLVSNIDNADLESALRHCELSFDFVVTSEDCRAYKPRGQVFERALTLLNRSAAEVLHVGDSWTSDVSGAKSNGIRALWINRKNRRPPEGQVADYVSTDLGGLLDILGGAPYRTINPIGIVVVGCRESREASNPRFLTETLDVYKQALPRWAGT